jgi:23S rRNA pseudouridine1911/1915/1917 synthase
VQPIQPNPRVTFRVVFEDENVLVVEKPPRVVSMPGLGHEHDTLLNGLFASHAGRLSQMGADRSFGLMHRLDRQTSGLMLVALSHKAYDHLFEQFRRRTIGKFYWALCGKAPKEPRGVIRFRIEEYQSRSNKYATRKLARVSRSGQPALTAYRVLESNDIAALIEARPVTGRLHQVRVHLDAIGCGILGDEEYGPKTNTGAAPRLALNAHRIQFTHPVSGGAMDFSSGWPGDLKRVLKRVRLARPDLPPLENAAHEPASDPVGEEDPALREPDA